MPSVTAFPRPVFEWPELGPTLLFLGLFPRAVFGVTNDAVTALANLFVR